MVADDEPSYDASDPGPPPPGWVSVEELGEQIMVEQLNQSTAGVTSWLLPRIIADGCDNYPCETIRAYAPSVGARRTAAFAMMGVALATLVVLYDSTPAKGAPHSANGWIVGACLVVFFACFGWFILDGFFAAAWRRRTGSVDPVTTVETSSEPSPYRLTFDRKDRHLTGPFVYARVKMPGNIWATTDEIPIDHTATTITTLFPDEFLLEGTDRAVPLPLREGQYHVHWDAPLGMEYRHDAAMGRFRHGRRLKWLHHGGGA